MNDSTSNNSWKSPKSTQDEKKIKSKGKQALKNGEIILNVCVWHHKK